jgi:ABC-type multidrug transport system ATPase subunit
VTRTGGDVPAIVFREFSLGYVTGNSEHPVLHQCSFELPRGGFYLLRGPSGSGKSTLLRFVTGLWDPRDPGPAVSGQCQVLGVNIEEGYPAQLRPRVAAVLQDVGLLDDLSPRENVELALRAAGRSEKLAVGLLTQSGVEHPPATVSALSGGMHKRVGVARGLAARPELFVFDEPTAGLDGVAARSMAELLFETHVGNKGQTTLVITHDADAFRGIASGIVEIDAQAQKVTLRDPGDDPLPSRTAGHAHRDRKDDPLLSSVRATLATLGSLTHTLGVSLVHLPPVFPRLCTRSVRRHLIEPALFIALGSAMLGFLATYFALRNNPLEGAFEDQILIGVGKINAAVLTPLVAGFFFTARMASGSAARLGTMKRSSQVSALTLMGIHAADYLLTPLVFGFCLALPVLTLGGVVIRAPPHRRHGGLGPQVVGRLCVGL